MSKYNVYIEDVSVEAIFNKLGGVEGARSFLRGETVVKIAEPPNFPVWKTITLGTGLKTAGDFRKALKKSGDSIGDRGDDILGKPAFTASDTEIKVDLVNVSVAELVFKDSEKRKTLESITAEDYIKKTMGKDSWDKLWRPPFIKKHGKHSRNIPASWFWARIKKRSKKLGYPQGGFQALAEKAVKHIKRIGCFEQVAIFPTRFINHRKY